jgi:peptide/nickel transport system permease protein
MTTTSVDTPRESAVESPLELSYRGRDRGLWPLVWFGGPLVLIALISLAAPLLPIPSPTKQDLLDTLEPPVGFGGTWAHPLGTDKLGRDLLSQLVWGGRLTLLIGVLGMLVAIIPGTLLGMLAGYRRGAYDVVISRLIDSILALPFVLIAIAIIANRGASIGVLLVVLAITGWAQAARITRAETLGLRERRFVLALRAAGASNMRIALRHVLPNLSGILVVIATLQIGTVILIESALSYLGLGVPPPSITWGSILAGGKDVLTQAWWITTFPGIAITVVVLLVNLLGDALLTTFDPKKRRY